MKEVDSKAPELMIKSTRKTPQAKPVPGSRVVPSYTIKGNEITYNKPNLDEEAPHRRVRRGLVSTYSPVTTSN